jgi:hypothetical protein
MKFIEKIHTIFSRLSEKEFTRYLLIALVSIVFGAGFIVYYYYTSSTKYLNLIKHINRMRVEVKEILTQNALVENHKSYVDTLLNEDPDFNLGHYFENLKQKLHIASDKSTQTTIDRDEYSESLVEAQFTSITMKTVAELLQEIEQNPRITIKELAITQGKDQTIDVEITIATLKKKPESTE